MNKKIKTTILLGTVFALAFTLQDIVISWSAPSSSAPGGDTSAPINEGASIQKKAGSIGINGLASFGGSVFFGGFQIKNGSEGQGKILVSDSAGNAQWVTPPNYAASGTAACPPGTSLLASTGECGYEYSLRTSGTAYCTGSDELVTYWNSCTGECRNSGIGFAAPNGCYAWEGPKNYGGHGCSFTCRGAVRMCMRMVNGDADWYLSGPDKQCNR